VFNLAGSFYSEQMTLWGYKYKDQAVISPDLIENEFEKGDTEKLLNEESKLWREWRGKGEATLILVAFTDDGNDVNDVIIPRCK